MKVAAAALSLAATADAVSLAVPKKVDMDPSLSAGVDADQVKAEYQNTTNAGTYFQDGYQLIDCINDKMLISGDKYGNPMDFDPATPVSVIRYDKVIPKPKQVAMSSEVCFNFCRKFDYMQSFGLVRGSECYCSSFFVATAGKSEGCEMPCAGNAAEMCGGQTKASVYQMHDCGRANKMMFGSNETTAFMADANMVAGAAENATTCAKNILAAGSALAKSEGKVGNKIAQEHHDAMMASQAVIQDALKALPIDPNAAADSLKSKLGEYSSMGQATTPVEKETISKALAAAAQEVADVAYGVANVAGMCEPLETPSGDTSVAKELTEAAHFLHLGDKNGNLTNVMCSGTAIQPVMQVNSDAECAKMCRETLAPDTCVGYQSYTGIVASSPKVVCMLFSAITSAVAYAKSDPAECGASRLARCRIPVTSEPLHVTLKEKLDSIPGVCFGEDFGKTY